MADNPITTPLPADLPTDWVYGQTIGPQGADVGLTQQHGYNYLMQQVNAAQQAAAEIGNAFSDLPSLGSDGKIPASQLPAMNYDPAGSAAAVQANLNAHTGDENNPHSVTSEQVGAMISSSTHYINSLDTLLTYAQSGLYTVSTPATGMPYEDFWMCLLLSDGRPVSGQYSRVVYASSANTNNLYKLVVTNGVNLGWIQLASLDDNGHLPVTKGGTGVGSIADLAAALAGTSGVLRIKTGSYVGTGGSGEGAVTTIHMDTAPKILIVVSRFDSTVSSSGGNSYLAVLTGTKLNTVVSSRWYNDYNQARSVYVTEFGASVSWYGAAAESQLNESGTTYDYYAFY